MVKKMLTIADFMRENLFNPEDGYYIKKSPLGIEGDFITAPEISQLFGEMIGVYCYDCWQKLGMPETFNLIELGPGRAKLMQDILRSTKSCSKFSSAINIKLVEVNHNLKKIQQETLKAYPIQWLEKIDDIDFSYPTIIIANEFFDCFPINQYVRDNYTWYENYIDQNTIVKKPIDKQLAKGLNFQHPNCNGILEISYDSVNLIEQISKKLNNGYFLIIDYGYDINPSFRYDYKSTLQSMRKHQYNDIFKHQKNADLTAHVDFYALKETALKNQLKTSCTITQKTLLENLGIHLRAYLLKHNISSQNKSPQITQIDNQLFYLLDETKMGNLFKCLTIFSKNLPIPIGFI